MKSSFTWWPFTKTRKCLQYSSYYCLEVMTMSCQWEVFSETEKRQRLVTLQEHKDDSHITLLSRIKTFSFFLCYSIEVSVSFGQEWKVGHTLQILLHISEMQKNYNFLHIFAISTNFVEKKKNVYIMQNWKYNFKLSFMLFGNIWINSECNIFWH